MLRKISKKSQLCIYTCLAMTASLNMILPLSSEERMPVGEERIPWGRRRWEHDILRIPSPHSPSVSGTPALSFHANLAQLYRKKPSGYWTWFGSLLLFSPQFTSGLSHTYFYGSPNWRLYLNHLWTTGTLWSNMGQDSSDIS